MTDYTEMEVCAHIAKLCDFSDHNVTRKMLHQLADMLAEREKAEPVAWRSKKNDPDWCYFDGPNDPREVHDHGGIYQRLFTHPAAQPRVPDADAVIAYLSRFSGFDGWWGEVDDETSEEIMEGLQCLLAAQESGR